MVLFSYRLGVADEIAQDAMETEVDADGMSPPHADIAVMQVVAHRGAVALVPGRSELQARIAVETVGAIVVQIPQVVVLGAGQAELLELLGENRTLRIGTEIVNAPLRLVSPCVLGKAAVRSKVGLGATNPLTLRVLEDVAVGIAAPDHHGIGVLHELLPIGLNRVHSDASPTRPVDVLRHRLGVAEQVHHAARAGIGDAGLVSPPRPAADLPLHHASDRRSSLDLCGEALTLKRGERFDAGREQLDAVLLRVVDLRTVAEEVSLRTTSIRHGRATLGVGEVVDFDLAHDRVLVGACGRERRVSVLCHSAPIVSDGETVSSLLNPYMQRTYNYS